MPKLLSVIIPTYNRKELLARALMSLVKQDYRPIEAIVIDDGSTDGTDQTIPAQRDLLASSGIELIYHIQPNAGPAVARNTALGMARGDYLGFLDSDDLWRPTLASTLAALLDRYPSAGMAFCAIEGIDDNDRVFAIRSTRLPPDPPEGLLVKPFEKLIHYMPTQTSGVMVRKSVIDALGVFDLEVPVVEDWDLWYRISKRYDLAYNVNALACNRSHPDNLPKYDIRALTSGLKMNLKHFGDIGDPATRRLMLRRIRHQMTLLQEDFLREGKDANSHAPLLEHPLAPTTPRYAIGRFMRGKPKWMGKTFAKVVRLLGKIWGGKVGI